MQAIRLDVNKQKQINAAVKTISSAIERMVEQNYDQKYSYNHASLIDMLDAAIAKQIGVSQQ